MLASADLVEEYSTGVEKVVKVMHLFKSILNLSIDSALYHMHVTILLADKAILKIFSDVYKQLHSLIIGKQHISLKMKLGYYGHEFS